MTDVEVSDVGGWINKECIHACAKCLSQVLLSGEPSFAGSCLFVKRLNQDQCGLCESVHFHTFRNESKYKLKMYQISLFEEF